MSRPARDFWTVLVMGFLGAGLAQCDARRPTTPPPVTHEDWTVPRPSSTVGPPTVVEAPPAPGTEGRVVEFGRFASGSIKNTTDIPQVYWACALRRNLDLAGVETTGPQGIRPGETWSFNLNLGCVQLDITQNGCGADFHPINFTWYGSDGRQRSHPSQVDWAECDKTVCVPTITERLERGPWSLCRRVTTRSCVQDRLVTRSTVNSCTGAQGREEWTEMRPCDCRLCP